jgi:hypothetical protein
VQVLLTITRLDSGQKQPAILDAQWRLIDRRGQVRDNRIVHLQEEHAGTTASQVQAQGVAAASGRAVVGGAQAIGQPAADCRSAAQTGAKPARQAGKQPKIPMASPIRTDMEVFRF